MDASIFPHGSPIESLPAHDETIVSPFDGEMLFVTGLSTGIAQLVQPYLARPMRWPCAVFAVTDGVERYAAAFVHDRDGASFEVQARVEGMKVGRALLRLAYATVLEFHLSGIEELRAIAGPNDMRARKNLRRLGFECPTNDPTTAELFTVATGNFLSQKLRRRIRRAMT